MQNPGDEKIIWKTSIPCLLVFWAEVLLLSDPHAEMRPSGLPCGARRGPRPWV